MAIKLSSIIKDETKREMYLLGFIHGNTGIKRRNPTYELESYERGYIDGSKGKLDHYLKVSEADGPKQKNKPLTRQKGKRG